MNKYDLLKKIYGYDFCIHEIMLFLDSHPTNVQALRLLAEYRSRRNAFVDEYEAQYGKYIVTDNDVPADGCWGWLKGPWPWENNFSEGM